MRSVADGLRASQRERLAALSADQRLDIAFEAGEADLELFCSARSASPAEGRAALRRARRIGRRPSRVMEEDQP